MKPGDLIRMKYMMFWHLKGNPNETYTEVPFLVLENMGKTQVRVLDSKTGRRRRVRIECYEVISAAA